MSRNWLFMVLAFVLTACGASLQVNEMEDPKSALVFGYIGAVNGPNDPAPEAMEYDWIQLRHIDAAGKEAYFTTRTDKNGMFYAENLPLGLYQLHRMGRGNAPVGSWGVGGNFGSEGNFVWAFGDMGKKAGVQVKKPGAAYIGTFNYMDVKGEGGTTFRIDRGPKPAEKELLQRLLPYTKDTHWEGSVNKRLAELH